MKLGMAAGDRPWTARHGVELKGLRRQAQNPNFIYDQIDFMYQEAMLKEKQIPSDEDSQYHDPGPVKSAHWKLPAECWTVDVREGTGHQRRDGNATLKTRSLLYSFARDRVLVGIEHLFLQGWDEDVDASTLNEPLPASVLDALDEFQVEASVATDADAPRKKRRKVASKNLDSTQKIAAGNAMVLADVGLLQFASLLAVDNPALWEHGPSERTLDEHVDVFQNIVVDPNSTTDLVDESEDEGISTSSASASG